MKRPLLAALALALAGSAALAQTSPPPPSAAAPRPAPEAAAPPALPGPAGEMRPDRGPERGPDRGPPGGPRRDGPPPPPPKAGHIKLESGDLKVDVRCGPEEPMRACADIAGQMLDKLTAASRR